jgi:hypothetical protein
MTQKLPESEDGRQIINTFVETTLSCMPPEARTKLPSDTADYLDAVVGRAVRIASVFDDAPESAALAKMVIDLYNQADPVRFVRNPVDDGPLMVGGDGEIVTLKGAVMGRISDEGLGVPYIKQYDYAAPVTGFQQGEHLTPNEYPIPAPH